MRAVVPLLAFLLQSVGLLAADVAPAAAEDSWWVRVRLETGDDDKRDDTRVTLVLRTTGGDRRIDISPPGERLADRTTKDAWFMLPTAVRTETITGCALEVDRGEGGGFTGADEWWMTGLQVSTWSNGVETTQFDFLDWSHKFSFDQVKDCPPREPRLVGRYAGSFVVDYTARASLDADFAGNPAATTATVTLGDGAAIDCYGRQAIPAGTVTASGRRTGYSPAGAPLYELGFTMPPSGGRPPVLVTIRGTLLNGGAWFDGTVSVRVDVPDPFGDCNRSGTFTTDRM